MRRRRSAFCRTTRALLLAVALLSALNGWAMAADRDLIFDDAAVGEIRATMSPGDLAWLLDPDHADNNSYLPATVHFRNPHFDQEFPGAGIRLRGNYGREAEKKSFKLALDRADPGADLAGLDRLNLIGEHNDPVILREKLTLDAYRTLGVPATRSSHVRFYLNGEYRGLYLLVEEADSKFLREHFGSDDGNLYQCRFVGGDERADLVYRPAEDYEFLGPPEERVYELEGDRRPDSFQDLAELIDVLNNTPDAQLADELEEIFNVAGFLRCLAVTVLAGSWDSYWGGGNNYFLFHNPVERRFEFIPRDCDMTFGINSINSTDYGTVNVYRFGRYDLRMPLVYRLLEDEHYRNLYTHFLNEALAGPLAPGTFRAHAEELRARIRPAALADSYRTRDFPFIDYDAFDRGFEAALGGHCPYGLYPYMETRAASAPGQMNYVSAPPAAWDLHIPRFVAVEDDFAIRVEAFDSNGLSQVKAWIDRGSGFSSNPLYDDGRHGDGAAGDGRFAATVAGASPGAEIELYVEARDGGGNATRLPREAPKDARSLVVLRDGPLVLNELMAENQTTIGDERGELEDWVELWNRGLSATDLSRHELIDDRLAESGWRLPAMSLPPGGRVVLWLDGEPGEGNRHAPFALDQDGEWLVLLERVSGGTRPVDAVHPPELAPDAAFGRVRDGDREWREVWPTPGSPNAPLAVEPGETPDPGPVAGDRPALRIQSVAPNPFQDEMVLACETALDGPIVLEIVDPAGRLRRRIESANRRLLVWDGRDASGSWVPAGNYYLRLRAGDEVAHARVTVVR